MQAKHLSGASIGKQTEYSSGGRILTNEHLWSLGAELGHLTHGPGTIELQIRHGATNWTASRSPPPTGYGAQMPIHLCQRMFVSSTN